MRYTALFILLVVTNAVIAQSPGLSVHVNINPKDTKNNNYLIEMKFCTPLVISENGDWFSHDTSAIIFNNLKANELECGNYMYNGEGKEILNGNKEITKYNSYEYSNQVFAWEKIIIVRITNTSPDNNEMPMYIAIPVKYKSFVTQIELNDIVYKAGKLFFLEEYNTAYKNGRLTIKPELKEHISMSFNDAADKEWLH